MTQNQTPNKKPDTLMRVFLWIIGGMFGLFLIGSGVTSCSPSSGSGSSASSQTSEERVAIAEAASAEALADASASAEAAARGEWDYSNDEDPMTGKATKTARVVSTNNLNLDSPYDGAQSGFLTVRNHPQYGHDIYVRIERGQLLCDISDGCSLMVRFDDEAPQAFSATTPSDNSSETLFIQNYKRFTTRLKTAKRVRIQLNVYDNGTQYLEFNTTGFDASKL